MADNTVNETLTEDGIIDMHGAYRRAQECGYGRDLTLRSYRSGEIASRLRGISSITAVLMTDKLDVELGDYIRSGLIEAVSALSHACSHDLEVCREMQEKEHEAAKTGEVQA